MAQPLADRYDDDVLRAGFYDLFAVFSTRQEWVTVRFWRRPYDAVVKIVVVQVLPEGEIACAVTAGITDDVSCLLRHVGGHDPGFDGILAGRLDEVV